MVVVAAGTTVCENWHACAGTGVYQYVPGTLYTHCNSRAPSAFVPLLRAPNTREDCGGGTWADGADGVAFTAGGCKRSNAFSALNSSRSRAPQSSKSLRVLRSLALSTAVLAILMISTGN